MESKNGRQRLILLNGAGEEILSGRDGRGKGSACGTERQNEGIVLYTETADILVGVEGKGLVPS